MYTTLPLFDHRIFALFVLLAGLMFLGLLLSDSRHSYVCPGCGSRNGEHAKGCHFGGKD